MMHDDLITSSSLPSPFSFQGGRGAALLLHRGRHLAQECQEEMAAGDPSLLPPGAHHHVRMQERSALRRPRGP